MNVEGIVSPDGSLDDKIESNTLQIVAWQPTAYRARVTTRLASQCGNAAAQRLVHRREGRGQRCSEAAMERKDV